MPSDDQDWQDVPLTEPAQAASGAAGDWQDVPLDHDAAKAAGFLRNVGQAAMTGIGNAAEGLGKIKDQFITSAPIRGAIDEFQQNGSWKDAAARFFMSDLFPEAPTTKTLLEQAGVPKEPISAPLITNPFKPGDEGKLQVTPSGIGAAALETALDPTTYLAGGGAAKGVEEAAEVGGKIAPEVANYLENLGAKRAVKATTGESIKQIRRAGGASIEGAKIGPVEDRLLTMGKALTQADEAGDPVVGFGDKWKNIAEKAEAKRQYYGKKIGEVGETIDKEVPNAVSGQRIADELMNFAQDIPEFGAGAAQKQRILEEAGKFAQKGDMSFKEAQLIKNQYQFEPQKPDALISSKDATNKIQSIISDEMENTVDTLKDKISPELLSQYENYKKQYGIYKGASSAATDATMRELSRRMISPSSHGLGIGAGIGTLVHTGSVPLALKVGGGTALANMMALGRGSSAAAATATAIASKIQAAPQVFGPWLPALQDAASKGAQSLVLTHHILMQNDPDYFNRFNQGAGE